MDDFDDTEEVQAQIDDVQREIDSIRLENEVFEAHFKRLTEDPLNDAEDSKKRNWNKQKRRNMPATLTIEQKQEVANAELEELQKETEEMKKSSEKLIDTLRAVLEDTDIKIAELKKEAYEFKRDVVVGAENMRTGKTMAEKIVKYMEEILRQKDALIEKLRLKNSSLKSQIQKVENQLRQKEEMGDVLHYIDFHQLQIENKQYVSKIEERNDELLELKKKTGTTVQALNKLKQELNDVISETDIIKKDIASRTTSHANLQQENALAQAEIAQERKTRRRLTNQQMDTSDMPQVIDYIQQKAEMYELQAAVRNWERKVEIAEMAAKHAKQTRRQVKVNSTTNGRTGPQRSKRL